MKIAVNENFVVPMINNLCTDIIIQFDKYRTDRFLHDLEDTFIVPSKDVLKIFDEEIFCTPVIWEDYIIKGNRQQITEQCKYVRSMKTDIDHLLDTYSFLMFLNTSKNIKIEIINTIILYTMQGRNQVHPMKTEIKRHVNLHNKQINEKKIRKNIERKRRLKEWTTSTTLPTGTRSRRSTLDTWIIDTTADTYTINSNNTFIHEGFDISSSLTVNPVFRDYEVIWPIRVDTSTNVPINENISNNYISSFF